MSNTKLKSDAVPSDERKVLTTEIKRLQKQLQQLKAKNQQQRDKVLQHQSHELALMQTNRMLVDMVKTYADREAVLMANWKTMLQTFNNPSEPDVVDLDGE